MSSLATAADSLAQVPPEHLPTYCLEAEILKQPQVEMPVEHAFCSGLYARTMRIPAGTVATGAVHRSESFFVVRSGTLLLATDSGPVHLEAGAMRITKAGDKRAVVAVTDVELTTFHPNPSNETDPASLWDLFTVPAPMRFLSAQDIEQLETEA
jgi:mannose-6-phosphate isomerase-like protein (cupin superfamily)